MKNCSKLFINVLGLLLLSSCLEVRVTGDPTRPLPVVAMGVTVQEQANANPVVTKHNPQLGTPPVPADYQTVDHGFMGTVLNLGGKLASGDYLGAIGAGLAALTGGYAVSQRRKAKKLARLPPEEAEKLL